MELADLAGTYRRAVSMLIDLHLVSEFLDVTNILPTYFGFFPLRSMTLNCSLMMSAALSADLSLHVGCHLVFSDSVSASTCNSR